MKAHQLARVAVEVPVEQFLSYLRKKGYVQLLPQIQRELILLHKRKKTPRTLQVASLKNAKQYSAALILGGEPAGFDIVVSDNIIGGYTYENERTYTDASFKKALIDLYQSLTT